MSRELVWLGFSGPVSSVSLSCSVSQRIETQETLRALHGTPLASDPFVRLFACRWLYELLSRFDYTCVWIQNSSDAIKWRLRRVWSHTIRLSYVLQKSVSGVTFPDFKPISLSILEDIILKLKSTTSPQDIVLTHLLRQVINSIGPFIVAIINKSLSSGVVIDYCKQAVVQPLLKKSNLDKCFG